MYMYSLLRSFLTLFFTFSHFHSLQTLFSCSQYYPLLFNIIFNHMMNMEILEDFTASNDQTMIVKGKRTKRLRTTSSSTSSCGGGSGGAVFNYNSSMSSPTTSTSTEEDEDMANCLILLARGGNFSPQSEIKPPEMKFRSRKFTEMETTTNGKVGIYVYECKTCGRNFASFQALGGHRASHKKPKAVADADLQKSAAAAPPREESEKGEGKLDKSSAIAPSTSTVVQFEIKSKIHECGICGSEFGSGQALGGHMRRHRSAMKIGGDDGGDQKSRNVLALDLNLPAPVEDDRREADFLQFSSNQQPRLVFSAAALVDCHY